MSSRENHNNGATTNSVKNNQNNSDETRKQLAKTVAEGYTSFYKNWVLKHGYELPSNKTDCTAYNGCSLSFPLGAVDPGKNFTYSINSLEESITLLQDGEKPNATKNNAALYKKAKCLPDGSVMGGNEDQNAATVIELSDGSFFCVDSPAP